MHVFDRSSCVAIVKTPLFFVFLTTYRKWDTTDILEEKRYFSSFREETFFLAG